MTARNQRPPTAGNGEGPESAATVNRCKPNSIIAIPSKHHQIGTLSNDPEWRMAWARVFPDALLAHIQPLSDAASAAWTPFWCYYLNHGGPVPDNAAVLARVCGGRTPKQWAKVRQEWIDQQVVECVDGFLLDRFIQAQIDYYRKKSETNRRNVSKRWEGRVEDAS